MASRQGFFWWEVDITYYMLRGLAAVGLIWDLKEVPRHIKYSKNKQEAQELRKKFEKDRPPLTRNETSETGEPIHV